MWEPHIGHHHLWCPALSLCKMSWHFFVTDSGQTYAIRDGVLYCGINVFLPKLVEVNKILLITLCVVGIIVIIDQEFLKFFHCNMVLHFAFMNRLRALLKCVSYWHFFTQTVLVLSVKPMFILKRAGYFLQSWVAAWTVPQESTVVSN